MARKVINERNLPPEEPNQVAKDQDKADVGGESLADQVAMHFKYLNYVAGTWTKDHTTVGTQRE